MFKAEDTQKTDINGRAEIEQLVNEYQSVKRTIERLSRLYPPTLLWALLGVLLCSLLTLGSAEPMYRLGLPILIVPFNLTVLLMLLCCLPLSIWTPANQLPQPVLPIVNAVAAAFHSPSMSSPQQGSAGMAESSEG